MKKWYEDLSDDKSMVIVAVLIIAIIVTFKLDGAEGTLFFNDVLFL